MQAAENQAADVRILVDKQAITEMLHRYCYAMDANDRQLGYEVWHADGTAHYEGMFDGLGCYRYRIRRRQGAERA
jgi:hypothetical protein